MKIVTIGAVTKDLFLRSDALPTIEQKTDLGELQQFLAIAYGSKINLTSLATGYGGGALNSGISFNRAGYDVTCYSRMGNDQIGSEIRNWLLHHAITAEQVTIDPTLPSAQSFILPCANKDRIIFTYRGALQELRLTTIPQQTTGVYCTAIGHNAAAQLPNLLQQARQSGCQVAMNPGIHQLQTVGTSLRNALAVTDIFILNAEESAIFAQQLPLELQPSSNGGGQLFRRLITKNGVAYCVRSYMHAVRALGPRIVIVTNGSEGVYVATNTAFYFHPSLPAAIVNTIGAGDAFGSAFCATLWQGKSIPKAIQVGLLNSKFVIETEDANSGIKPFLQLYAAAEELPNQLITIAY